MKRYLLRYLVFWLPAFLISAFLPEGSRYYFVLRWFTLFFMMFGWAVNTGMASANFPRNTLSAILIYFGSSILMTTGWYMGYFTRAFGRGIGYILGGFLSYVPLEALVIAILDYNIMHEIYAISALVSLCLIGWISGIIYRYLKPNPYRPRFK